MSQFDKDDVEELGLLKLDVLGIRMQSAMAHAVAEVERVDGVRIDLDDEVQVPFDDAATYDLISSAKTLGVFQIESPGQRELVGKSGIETFDDIITDISLFRPGPVKSDMITPYLDVKQGWTHRPLPPRRPAPDPRADPRRGGLPRAGDRDDRAVRRRLPRRGRREAPGARQPRRDGRDAGRGSSPARWARATTSPWSSRSGGCSRPSRRSASARPTPPRSPSRPTSRRGSRRTGRPTSCPACSPTTRACIPSA